MSVSPTKVDSLLAKRKEFSKATMGMSSSVDLKLILQTLESLKNKSKLSDESRVIDIGCGQGELLEMIHSFFGEFKLSGMDLESFDDSGKKTDQNRFFQFFQHDLNIDFPNFETQYDVVICSHVILYLENPRHFIREIANIMAPGGHLIINNPNVDGWRNLVSVIVRGYPYFCPPRYPGHITAPSFVEMKRIIEEVPGLDFKQVKYTDRGRAPGLAVNWQSIAPFFKGQRFSDAYSIVAEKKA